MDETINSQINWICSIVKKPLNTVIGDWLNHNALLWTESVQNESDNGLLVNSINQWGVDTIMP